MGENFCPFHKNFFYSNPLFSPTTRVNPKHADERLVIRNDLPKQKSEVNRNKKKLKSPKGRPPGDNLLPKIVVGAMNKPTLLLANY